MKIQSAQERKECTVDAYNALCADDQVDCTLDEFIEQTAIHESAHSVYTHTVMTEVQRAMNISRLLNVTSEQLFGYENGMDWLVMQDPRVTYIDSLDLYVRARTNADIRFDKFNVPATQD